ncbi:MAG: iron-containing redox enzyme family protein [Planctomycetes bacterium]|nr:iron-containing redox enzyme family protein [Planctomycetota bacterium]
MPDGATFLKALEAEVNGHEAVKHPFLVRFSAGGLSPAQIQRYAMQHYQMVQQFPVYVGTLLPRLPGKPLKTEVSRAFGLGDGVAARQKDQNGKFERLLAAAGLKPKDWAKPVPCPAVKSFIDQMTKLAKFAHPVEALGAVTVGHVWIVDATFGSLREGLRRSSIDERELGYFTEHVSHGDRLSSHLGQALAGVAAEPEPQRMLREGAMS